MSSCAKDDATGPTVVTASAKTISAFLNRFFI
jgi:hypothetical protein